MLRFICRLQHCLEWTNMQRAYSTPDSVVTYLFLDLRTRCLSWAQSHCMQVLIALCWWLYTDNGERLQSQSKIIWTRSEQQTRSLTSATVQWTPPRTNAWRRKCKRVCGCCRSVKCLMGNQLVRFLINTRSVREHLADMLLKYCIFLIVH